MGKSKYEIRFYAKTRFLWTYLITHLEKAGYKYGGHNNPVISGYRDNSGDYMVFANKTVYQIARKLLSQLCFYWNIENVE